MTIRKVVVALTGHTWRACLADCCPATMLKLQSGLSSIISSMTICMNLESSLPSLYCEDEERLSLKLRGKVSAPEGEVGTQSR